MNSDSHSVGNYRQHQKKEGHSGWINSHNGKSVLLPDFKQLFKPVNKEMDN